LMVKFSPSQLLAVICALPRSGNVVIKRPHSEDSFVPQISNVIHPFGYPATQEPAGGYVTTQSARNHFLASDPCRVSASHCRWPFVVHSGGLSVAPHVKPSGRTSFPKHKKSWDQQQVSTWAFVIGLIPPHIDQTTTLASRGT